jgi:PAS domain S-box-containing protein
MFMLNKHFQNQSYPSKADLTRQITCLEKGSCEKQGTMEALEESEKRYRRLFESAKDGILILDADTGKVVDVNPFLLQLLGYSYNTLCGQYIWELGVFKDIAASKDAFKILQDNEYIRYEDLPLETFDGKPIAVEFVSNVYLVDHAKVIQCNIRDITERKRADAERKRLLAAVEQAGEAIVMTDTQGIIQFVNPAFEKATGYTRQEVVGQNSRILKSGDQDDSFYRGLWDTISSGKNWAGRMVNKRKDGTPYTEETTISPVLDASNRIVNYVAVKRDITENLRLAAQYQQSQKMEAVGMLAGGVAHDYNNMLTVILGYAELALNKVDPHQSLHTDLKEIIKAAKHSADITRQLLTFARKQTIYPVVLDLNKGVESMLTMLRKLMGENIDVTWLPGADLGPIKMDPVQVNQILTNLCVNARDAIADVGRVTIETRNAVFEDICKFNHGAARSISGKYVLLSISDNGCGMDKEILNKIFQPFFTSKELGLGCGLGLSTVYGIVTQNNGFIDVDSVPGVGTTFTIYLPQHGDYTVKTRQENPTDIPQGHGETVLVVEDEPALLGLAKTMLEVIGYQVLAADTPTDAIRLAEEHSTEIHLVITDVIMPEMNGRDLAEHMRSAYPTMKILFMSGYSAAVIAHQGTIDNNLNFIQKPFTVKNLAIKVQEVLREM